MSSKTETPKPKKLTPAQQRIIDVLRSDPRNYIYEPLDGGRNRTYIYVVAEQRHEPVAKAEVRAVHDRLVAMLLLDHLRWHSRDGEVGRAIIACDHIKKNVVGETYRLITTHNPANLIAAAKLLGWKEE